ncbi:MAG: hypothetical protein ACI9OJ_004671 [Myxococcota bacterium]|jgi:hypothetical protein
MDTLRRTKRPPQPARARTVVWGSSWWRPLDTDEVLPLAVLV